MATPTLANPIKPDFRMFPTGEAEYSWRIAASSTKQTISRHKSLAYAIRKCTRLNGRSGKGAGHDSN